MIGVLTLFFITSAYGEPAAPIESFKDQFCTDPRTMRKHAAYTEWADAYSCTRHRCQPGGRNLAIYTVGCKRVEAPESAIECEEVVEDTNMQFPYCCTRLRCLVVVRGEVWTRVLGQPWETLPAAPWSHMYKMKKPPPGDTTFLPKSPGEGPIYELQKDTAANDRDKVLRSGKKGTDTEAADCNEIAPRAAPAPDIVIALSTDADKPKPEQTRYKHGRKSPTSQFLEEDAIEPRINEEQEEQATEKQIEPVSEERYYANAFGVTQKAPSKVSWTEIPQNQWNEHDEAPIDNNGPRVSYFTDNTQHSGNQPPKLKNSQEQHTNHHQPEFLPAEPEKKEDKPVNLQSLVDAIGTRMRDIESVVQKMSEKVQKTGTNEFGSGEKRRSRVAPEADIHKHHNSKERKEGRMKKPNPDGEQYKRFLRRGVSSTELPLFVEDSKLNGGYFSDASNLVQTRRSPPKSPKEPAATYMAPVENRRKSPHEPTEGSDEAEKKRKKHMHKKKHTKGSHHKKHHNKDDKRKRFNRLNSMELDKNVVSLEDSNAEAGSK